MSPILIPLRTCSENNMREHHMARARRRKQQRITAALMTRVTANQLGLPCSVKLVRIAPSNGLDGDNLQGALKAVRDGIADAFEVDDRDPRLTWVYDQRRGPYSVEVTLMPVALSDGIENAS